MTTESLMVEPAPEAAPERRQARRVLVAEDSSAVQDLLELVLGQRGLEVQIAADGRAALEALKATPFDVALLDFNMPEMNGLEVVTAFLQADHGETRPHFVAITGDIEGLLSSPHNCEQFDRVLPKPLDISSIGALIEELGAARPVGDKPQTAAPAPLVGPPGGQQRSQIEELDYRFLRWPEGADRRRLALGVGAGGYDAILIYDLADLRHLAPIWEAPGLHLLPVVDLTGRLGPRADLDAASLDADRNARVEEVVETFRDRRAALHADLVRAESFEDRLLGRVHVAGGELTPRHDGAERGMVSYNAIVDPAALRRAAQKLVKRELLSAAFFDRLHICVACESARFNVREECPECGGAHLDEQSYLHHFRCAYQGPESDFRVGEDLVCPKCRREMRHFGQDYDRPGQMVACADCGHSTSEPNVGFVCVDCGARADGDAVSTQDVFRHQLTDQGRGYLEAGAAFLGFAQQSLRFADLPLDLVVALNAEAKLFNDAGTPFTLLSVGYEREREITRENGARQFAQLRTHFVDRLHQGLGEQAKVVRGANADFALLKGVAPDEIGDQIEALKRVGASELRLDPGLAISAFGPQDLT